MEKGQTGSPMVKRIGEKEYIVGIHVQSVENGSQSIKLTLNKRKMITKWI